MDYHPSVELVEYTDPYCTWCWGSEPILRHIQEVYGDQVQLSFVMGGLVDNSENINDPANGIGGRDWKRQVAAHWLDASSRHGMPVDVSQFVEKVAPVSTYPANIAYEAAKLQDPATAGRYLRRLREAAAIESRSIHLPDVQADIAEEVGLDRRQFLASLAGPARAAFEADRRECLHRGIHGFPTFLVRSGGHEKLLRGYQGFESIAAAIDSLAGRQLAKRQPGIGPEGVLEFVRKYGSTATREVAEVFEVADSEADAILRQLAVAGKLVAVPAGTGNLYRADRPQKRKNGQRQLER
jgi:putative protein-disulfide isomerase